MASSYTTSLKIQQIGAGEQSGVWGSTTNTNNTLVEQAITGVAQITMANSNYTLSSLNGVSDEARCMVIVAGGTNSAVYQIIAPLVKKFYIVNNSTVGGFAVTIGGATGSIISIPNGVVGQVYCDGTNFFSAQTGSAGNFNVNGNLTVAGITTLTGALGGSTAVFSGAISSVSPTFTGTPTAPTAAPGTSTTQLATTAFTLANANPTGSLIMWTTGTAPTGWLLCAGAAVSRSTYAALFAVVGTTFGVGDGTTTFNVPNYTNRMPYGATVGTTGGSADAVLVSHTHTATSVVTDPGHVHPPLSPATAFSGPPNSSQGLRADVAQSTNAATTGSAVTGITVATTNASAGVSGTNANLSPYLGINFIIKT